MKTKKAEGRALGLAARGGLLALADDATSSEPTTTTAE
jgi:hypothetical protein